MITKMTLSGKIDSLWGNDGTKRIYAGDFTGDTMSGLMIQAQAIQPDGKILIGGTIYHYHPTESGNNGTNTFIARLLSDGSIDASFGAGGIIMQEQPFATYITEMSIKVLADNSIMAAVGYDAIVDQPADRGIAVLRLNGDGTGYGDYASTGFKFIPITEYIFHAFSLDIQDNGKVIVSGNFVDNEDGSEYYNEQDGILLLYEKYYIGMCIRVNATGTLDNSFGDGGIFSFETYPSANGGQSIFGKMTEQKDGKIIITGKANVSDSSLGIAAIGRINADSVSNPIDSASVTSINAINPLGFACSLYPNPLSNSVLNVKFDNTVNNISYQIYDILGKEVDQGIQSGQFTQMTLLIPDNLGNGIYTLKITNTGFTYSKKFVLKR